VKRTAKRTISGLLGAAAFGLTLAVVPTGPANAHAVEQGGDFADHAYGGTYWWVCDRESDENSVWAEYYVHRYTDRFSQRVVYDPDTYNCAITDWAGGYYLSNLRVVEIADGGTRYYGPWHGGNFNQNPTKWWWED